MKSQFPIESVIRAITETPNLSDPRVMIYESESYTIINPDDPEQIPAIPASIAVCPICGAALVIETIDEYELETGRVTDCGLHITCETEPDWENEDYEDWLNGHFSMPYVDWLPIGMTVSRWFNKHYRLADGDDREKLAKWNLAVEGWQSRRQDKRAYRLALAFLAWVDDTATKNRQGGWMWMTVDGRRLTTVEHVAAALLSGDLAPLPGETELPVRYLTVLLNGKSEAK